MSTEINNVGKRDHGEGGRNSVLFQGDNSLD